MARKFLEIYNWKTGEVATRMDVTGRPESVVDRIEMGALMKCDVERGWGVREVEEQDSIKTHPVKMGEGD